LHLFDKKILAPVGNFQVQILPLQFSCLLAVRFRTSLPLRSLRFCIIRNGAEGFRRFRRLG
jgi:hypothetical protein